MAGTGSIEMQRTANGTDLLDFHGCQSGHGLEGYESWKYVERMRKVQEIPCIDRESRYEEFPVCFRPEIHLLSEI